MRFAFYHDGINAARTMVVDGVEKCRVNLSHWPGNETPEHLKADTSTEIALNLDTDPYADRLFENIDTVSNNHFDTDGLLSCWVAMNPRQAMAHKSFLIQAAQAGDFEWFTTPQAVQFDMVVSAFEDPQRSPLRADFAPLDGTRKFQLLYDTLLNELPGLFENFESRYRHLYEEEYAKLIATQCGLANGRASIQNHSREGLAILEALEPFALRARFNAASTDRLLTLTRCDGGWTCEFHYHVITWFETKSVAKRPRVALDTLAQRLNQMEGRNDACWRADSLTGFYPRLALLDAEGALIPTRLPKESIVREFLLFFENADRIAP